MISRSGTLNDNKSGQEVQLLEELVEDLGARIYEHKFEQGVSVIETGNNYCVRTSCTFFGRYCHVFKLYNT